MIILPYFKNPEPISGAETTKSNSRQSQMRVFAFNVTSIPGLETVVAAELRLNGLRNIALKNQANNLKTTNSSHLEWTAVLAAYKVAKSEENQTRNVRTPSSKNGRAFWLIFVDKLSIKDFFTKRIISFCRLKPLV